MRTGIILANTGTPAGPEPDQIESYLKQFLMDPRIRQLPKPLWRYLVYRHILPKRKFTSSERYKKIWREDGSPLVNDQQQLANLVQGLFEQEGRGVHSENPIEVTIGMSYGEPSLVKVLEDFRTRGFSRIVLLPTYPQSAFSPTQAVIDAFWLALKELDWQPQTTIVDNYHDNKLYIDAVARAIDASGYSYASGDRLMLSMHSIPLKDKKAGDTYVDQIQHSYALLAEKLSIPYDAITMSFQSVFGHSPEKWQGPQSLDVLSSWREEGFSGRVVFMCPGFAIDCLETLYDIPYEMCPAFCGEGVTPDQTNSFIWIKCLGPTAEHAAIMKDVIDNALGE